jgi:uncharacterized Fe-S center protein
MAKAKNLIFGIYTPLEFHTKAKPSLKNAPYNYCWVCRKHFHSDYMKWWRKKQRILANPKLEWNQY